MGRALFLVSMILFCSCSTTNPRGQVVRLQPESGSVQREISPLPTPSHQATQMGKRIFEVPEATEDAAVFHFSQGQAYSLDNDPLRAIESYRATLVHDPKSALVKSRLAAELVKVGAYAEAKSLCEESMELDPKYVDSYLLLAGIQVAAKEYEGALRTYERALMVEPKNRDALLYHGVTLAEVGKAKEGISQLEKLVKLKDSHESNIDQSVAFYYLAKVHEQVGQKQKAMESYRKSLERRPNFSKAAIGLADLYLEKKDEKSAYSVLEEAFREGKSSDLAERLADMYLEKNNFKRAVVYLETLVEEDPANENMKLRLGLVYWQLQWFDKAGVLLSELIKRYPESSEIAFYLGELEVERKNFPSALYYFLKIKPDYPKFDQMVSRVVFVYRQQKNPKQAESFLLEALRVRPDLASFYPLLAAIYEEQGKFEETKLALERGEKLFPNDESILYYLGFLYDRLGKKEQGLATMERLLVISPKNANALNFVGYTLVERGLDLPRAKELLQRALAEKPKDPFILDSYGWLLYRLGKSSEAMKYLELAVALKPQEAVIAEHLADVYLALNLVQKAWATFSKARELAEAAGEKELVFRVSDKMGNMQQSLAENAPKRSRPKRSPASAE